MTFRLRPRAEADIRDIALYIGSHNPQAAWKWRDDVLTCCQRLAEFPQLGVSREEVRKNVRSFALGNYLILYTQIDHGVEIVRVVHGARMWRKLV